MVDHQLVEKAIRQFHLKRTGETVERWYILRSAPDGPITNIFLCNANDFVMAVYFVHDQITGKMSYRTDLPHQYPFMWKFTIDEERYTILHWIDDTPFVSMKEAVNNEASQAVQEPSPKSGEVTEP